MQINPQPMPQVFQPIAFSVTIESEKEFRAIQQFLHYVLINRSIPREMYDNMELDFSESDRSILENFISRVDQMLR